MITSKAVEEILSYGWPSNDQLVAYAISGHGFSGDGGYFGVTYPSDLDDHDKACGNTIPQGMLELTYRDDEIKEILVKEEDYLALLASHLENNNAPAHAQEVRKLVNTKFARATD